MNQTVIGALHLQFLQSSNIAEVLSLLLKVAASCRKGCIQMIQNSVGGHLTMTSTSLRLLPSLSVSKPINRLIIAAVQGHLQHFSDGGSFVLMLTILLLTKTFKLTISHSYIADLLDKFLNMIVHDMSSDVSKIKIDISNLKQMTAFVKSILGTKPLCRLSDQDLDDLSKLLMQIFVNYLPLDGTHSGWEQNIHFICDEGLPVSHSHLFQGLLLQSQHMPKQIVQDLSNNIEKITVVMVEVSMSGDTEEIPDAEYEISSEISPEMTSIEKIMRFCDTCKSQNVGILFCQRVIHPVIKKYLIGLNILPIERLGSGMFQLLLKLSESQSIRRFSVCKTDLGQLDSVEQRQVNNKSFLFLKHHKSPTATLLLTNHNEESLQELKAVCGCVLHSLERIAFSSFVLPGGGCWEIRSSHHLREQKVKMEVQSLVEEFHCSKLQVMATLDVCCTSLQTIAKTNLKDSEEGKTDPYYHHFWKVPKEMPEGEITCSCGIYSLDIFSLLEIEESDSEQTVKNVLQENFHSAVSQRTVIIDQLDMCINAVRTAILTASSVLSTNLFICDGENKC